MSDFDYDDVYELERDLYSKNSKTPQQIMQYQYDVVHKRDWKSFLNSIEWDGLWLRQETEEEKKIRLEEQEERKREYEMETHPFRQWF